MITTTQWNLGNFTVALSADTEEAFALEVLAPLGLRFLGHRNPDIDRVLGGYVKGADGKSTRVKGFKRSEVAYSDALAKALAASFAELTVPDSEEGLEAAAVVSEYVREAAALKYKNARECASMHESAGDIEKWAETNLNYTGPTHGEDGEYAVEMLQIIHAKLVAKRKADLATI